MHAIEFETTSHQNTIRFPDGVLLRVLLLSEVPLAKPVDHNLKALLALIAEGMTDTDTAGSPDSDGNFMFKNLLTSC